MPNSHRNHFCAYAVMWKKVSGSGTCVQASLIGSAQVETLKHIRAFSIDSRARLLSLPEPKRTDDRDEVHDLKKCARIEVVYDDSARPRATFFFFSSSFLTEKFLRPSCRRDAQTKCQLRMNLFHLFQNYFSVQVPSLLSKFLNRLNFILLFEDLLTLTLSVFL